MAICYKVQKDNLNNSQLINTLQQRNQNLCNKISILKERLLEETTKLVRISEERDSYKTALQILTKELRIDGPVALSSNVDQVETNFAEATKRSRLNSRLTGQATRLNSVLKTKSSVHSHNLRNSNYSLFVPRPSTEAGKRSFQYRGSFLWNSLPLSAKIQPTISSFRSSI